MTRVVVLALALGLLAAACGAAPADPLPVATATPVPSATAAPPDRPGGADGGVPAASPEAPAAVAAPVDPDAAPPPPVAASDPERATARGTGGGEVGATDDGAGTDVTATADGPRAGGGDAAGGRDVAGSGPDRPAGDDPGEAPGADRPADDGADEAAGADRPAGDGSGRATSPGASPTHVEVAAFVRVAVDEAGDGADHVVADLDGDEVPEVVVVAPTQEGVRGAVWWWVPGDGFGEASPVDAGPGTEVVWIGVGDITLDGRDDLLVRVGGGARDSLALWSVAGPGEVAPLRAVGGCYDGSHVYGSTSAVLQSRPDGPAALVATCDDSPLAVADWSTAVYEFSDGAYRFVEQDRALPAGAPTDAVDE